MRLINFVDEVGHLRVEVFVDLLDITLFVSVVLDLFFGVRAVPKIGDDDAGQSQRFCDEWCHRSGAYTARRSRPRAAPSPNRY